MKKILVIVRETFPTNEILTEKNLKEKYILNPYDEYALFQAKKIKEEIDIELTCLFISHRESQYGLRTALALGADRGIFIYCQQKNIREVAKNVAIEIDKENYDSIFMGIRDVNNDREELPSRLAVLLKLPLFSHILSINYDKKYIAKQERDKTIDILEIQENGIFAFSQNVYEPEYPSISSIMSIKDKKIITANYPATSLNNETKIYYQDIHRKKEIHKKISSEEGTELVIEYMKKWKLVE